MAQTGTTVAGNTTTAENGRSLFVGFGAVRTATTADSTTALTDGLVAPDSNVLLNLYQYTEQPRPDLVELANWASLRDTVAPHADRLLT
ncbi:hypothetical protein [Streptomyces sp. ISL-100]|uniref:hypothetical protein n=1 Tax=Streptomyces sp. ISL-100 TaxID=2819173 RepID=UPI001BE822FD|nr:hypothetical protein [Streptomyces sp. ISL-100]MBT2398310.1 hypothetical protein [Streptomyces sp. ISL-100]